jgi:holliday junction DNA helicase RuvB
MTIFNLNMVCVNPGVGDCGRAAGSWAGGGETGVGRGGGLSYAVGCGTILSGSGAVAIGYHLRMATERIVSGKTHSPAEEAVNLSLRPTRLDDYVGQPRLIEKLRITLQAVKERHEPMEHVLLHGPPGLGKTTLAHVIANEMDAHLTVTSGPALTKPGDLVGFLTKLQRGDVLFIDEVHRMPVTLEEYLYSAMEDFKIDVTVDQGMHAKTITLPLQPFTLIGATTRAGLISGPMRSRFGLTHNLEFYPQDDLLKILHRSAALLNIAPPNAGPNVAPEHSEGAGLSQSLAAIASRSRGTPRIANRLLRRIRDFAQVRHNDQLTPPIVDEALELEGVDDLGLDELDRKYLRVIATTYEGGPVGVEAIAATLGEDAGTLEEVCEPYLLQVGFLARTRKGRQLTKAAAEHLGVRFAIHEQDAELFE